ncbi:MAG: carbohydrate ABC transporter substrate-binding protein [Hyphomicrobiales bacterium]|nr:MAG: carbohydrate ABC transporter substrate-binding protein [Hyphomicrobiales bacterium]
MILHPLYKRTAFLLASTLLTSALATQAFAVELRVAWWGGDARQVQTNAALTLISESKLSDVTYVGESQGRAQYLERLATQLAGGNAPDLIQTASPDLPQFHQLLLDLTPYIESGALDISGIDRAMLDAQGTIDGKIVGIPFSIQAFAVLANKTAFDKYGIEVPASWDWAEYGKLAQAISDASGGALKGSADESSIQSVYEGWYQTRTGKTLWTAEGARNDTVEDLEAWFTYWGDLRASGAIVSADVQASRIQGDNTTSILVTGKGALETFVSSGTGSYQALMTDLVAPLPLPDDGNPANSITAGTMFSVPASTQHADIAVATLNLMLNDPEAAAILGMTRGSPGTAAAREAVAATLADGDPLKAVVQFDSLVAAGATGAIRPSPPSYADENNLFARIGQEVAFGQRTAADGAKAFFDQLPGVVNR